MNWTSELPKVEGWYLRANPPCPGFMKLYILLLDVDCARVKKGELGVNYPKVGGSMMRVSDLPKFYWFGPIPKTPTKQLRENIG